MRDCAPPTTGYTTNVPAMLFCRWASLLQAAAVGAAAVEDGSPTAAADAGLSRRRILQGLSAQRVQRLETMVEIKKLYRNIIRAEALLALPSPVYKPPEGEGDLNQHGVLRGQPIVAGMHGGLRNGYQGARYVTAEEA